MSEKSAETVAVYSPRNIYWQGIGRLSKGYNIMTKDKADMWITMDQVRLATPQEVAKEYEV